jgi:chaperonin GroEL (HSP60 family)
MIRSNIVKKSTLREVQLSTLEFLKDCLKCSFGPNGTYSEINKQNMLSQFTKDGHTILNNIFFQGVIENSVKNNLVDLTTHIVKEVGDGTTGAVILSYLIFKALIETEKEAGKLPSELIKDFKAAVKNISEAIRANGRETTLEDIYHIALVSTDNNVEVAENIRTIYEEFGMSVFIDVSTSTSVDSYTKYYDGLTIESGYADNTFINDLKRGTCTINNPKVYVFEDPIDTPELVEFLDKIIATNIFDAYNKQDMSLIIPTVVLAPKMSRDMDSYMDKLTEFMCKLDPANKPPFLLITNIYDTEQFLDIAKLCGAKSIKKYIDLEFQKQDIAKGLAPTIDNVCGFAGSCEVVESDAFKTKFINPKDMRDENGEYSALFTGMLTFLEAELEKASREGANINIKGELKRRINSLKSNLVDYYVGGVTMSDRDSVRDLVEDAVKNCRIAARNGVGYGANFEALNASIKLLVEKQTMEPLDYMYRLIHDAYRELSIILYETCISEGVAEKVKESIIVGKPINLRTKEFDGTIKSAIDSDIVVLDTISKIVTLMFTCNQFICETPIHNTYFKEEDIKN